MQHYRGPNTALCCLCKPRHDWGVSCPNLSMEDKLYDCLLCFVEYTHRFLIIRVKMSVCSDPRGCKYDFWTGLQRQWHNTHSGKTTSVQDILQLFEYRAWLEGTNSITILQLADDSGIRCARFCATKSTEIPVVVFPQTFQKAFTYFYRNINRGFARVSLLNSDCIAPRRVFFKACN